MDSNFRNRSKDAAESSWLSHPPGFPTSSLPKSKMPSFDSYNAKTTSVSYPWPKDVTGIERIALSAQGDLQRVLSAFFARPIVIALVYSQTFRQPSPQSTFEPVSQITPSLIDSVSVTSPIIQTRQVHLQCGGKIACTATSTVRITSPECAHLFLQEKYAIGQMFRRLEKVPAFELRSVGVGPVSADDDPNGADADADPSSASRLDAKAFGTKGHPVAYGDERVQLWRKYTLMIPHFECEILEVFPAREMFGDAEAWLDGRLPALLAGSVSNGAPSKLDRIAYGPGALTTMGTGAKGSSMGQQAVRVAVGLLVLMMVIMEVSMYRNGRFAAC